MREKYGTTIDGIEWGIDLERRILISTEDLKMQRKLNQKEIIHLTKLIKNKDNGRKNKM